MLENLQDPRILKALSETSGKFSLKTLMICNYVPGLIFRAVTESGNSYLFEIIEPATKLLHVVRLEARPGDPEAGYRGQRRISGEVAVGKPIFYGDSSTSPVKQLVLIG